MVALDGEGNAVAGLAMTVKLIHRQWNSVLQASDFAQGSAKYQTQVLDETVGRAAGDQRGGSRSRCISACPRRGCTSSR